MERRPIIVSCVRALQPFVNSMLMFIPASSEFVALCKSQVAVLTQGLGAALSAVYLAEELVEGSQAKLIPVVVYPEAGVWEEEASELMLPSLQGKFDMIPRLSRATPRLLPQVPSDEQAVDSASTDWEAEQENLWQRQRQIVLPLMHEGVVMGLLVTGREDRAWNETEKATIERIARTLAIAYIMDRRQVWSEQQLAQARHLQARKRDRLDDLLHQLRNPLTAVRTFGKLIFKRLLPGDKNQELASGILRESDRLQELLKEFDTYLNESEDEFTPLLLPATTLPETALYSTEDDQTEVAPATLLPARTLRLESLSIVEVLDPLIVSAQVIAQERDLELQAEIPPDLPRVRGNAKGLREVLSNLIDNALKYTPQGGRIDIRVGVLAQTPEGETIVPSTDRNLPDTIEPATWVSNAETHRLAILISDTGPGIPPQDLEHLFQRHYRGVQASTAIPGSGLGLAIAKELIEQMQGKIEVFSPARWVWAKLDSDFAINQTQDNQTQGTTFVVWLPIE